MSVLNISVLPLTDLSSVSDSQLLAGIYSILLISFALTVVYIIFSLLTRFLLWFLPSFWYRGKR